MFVVYGCVLVLQAVALADRQLISTKVSGMKAAAGEIWLLVTFSLLNQLAYQAGNSYSEFVQACGVRRNGSELCSSRQHLKGPVFAQESTDLSSHLLWQKWELVSLTVMTIVQ